MKSNKVLRILLAYFSLTMLLCHRVAMSQLYASFEDIGVGARATGMGNVFTSLCDDVYSLYYNPAGLGQVRQREFTSSYGRLFWGLDDGSNLGSGFLGIVYPFRDKIGTFGFGWLNFSLYGYYQENTFLFSYGRKISKILPVYSGLNLKILTKKYNADDYTKNDPVFSSGYSKSGPSADLGLLWRLPYSFYFGFAVTDLLQPDLGLRSKSIVPLGVKLGLSYRSRALNIAVEGSYRDEEMKIYTGAEKWFLENTLGVRTGLSVGNKNFRNFTLGASYEYSLLRFDYAFLFPLSGLTDMYGSHRLGLTFRFGPFAKEEIEDTYILQKKISDLEKEIKELEKAKNKTDEELNKTKAELEKLKKEKVAPAAVTPPTPVTPPGRPPGVTPQPPTVRTHKVLEGETLRSIAVKYYGDEKHWVDIYNANKDKIERGVVKPGQILIIP